MPTHVHHNRSPWRFVPTMGLFQALTFAYVSILPGVFLKSIGAPNSMVGLASLFYLPVALRFLVGSIVDRHGSKRLWSLWTQIAQVLVAALSGALILAGAPVMWVLVCFGLASIVGAFLDLSNDGFFLVGTPADRKAFFATLKVQAFRIGNAVAQGGYVMAAGALATMYGGPKNGWGLVFALHACILLALALWHFFAYPRLPDDQPDRRHTGGSLTWFKTVFAELLREPGMWWVLAYLAAYRVGESMLSAMKVPFMLDPTSKGGLGLDLQQVGFMNGVVVFLVLVVGGLIGGTLVERLGLRRMLVPGILLTNVPNILFTYLSLQPSSWSVEAFGLSIPVVAQIFLAVEAFGYSLGFAPFIYVQVLVSRGPAQATIFAIVAGITNLGWTLPGAVSGFVQEATGYPMFFVLVMCLGLAVLLLAPKIPADELEDAERRHRSVS
jgi:PAT family beta-lactamase induction signal transducer AmpG